MADTTVTHTIFFIAAVLVAASLAGVFIGLSQDLAHGLSERSDQMQEQSDSEFVLINDPAMMPYSENILTVYLKNLSSRVMTQTLDIFIDGTLITTYTVLEHQSGTGWTPSEVISLNIGITLSGGDHHLKIVLSNGVFAEMMFRI